MKTVAGGLILALVLFAIAAVSWSEARLTRQVAAAHQRLATLHYDEDTHVAENGILDRLPMPGSSQNDLEVHKATVQYWLARYEVLTPLTGVTGNQPASDSNVLFVAANAAFRASHPEAGDRKASVDRLDSATQAYADVLRADPNQIDAAFNYEYVARLRDTLAKNKPIPKQPKPSAPDVSADLPSGPTLHGHVGGPPPNVPMSDFKTVSPMQFEEREEQAQPGKGKTQQRRG